MATLPLIQVLVVNDQRAMCQLWQTSINITPGMACPAFAMDGETAIHLIPQVRPDVVLMDILMPGMGGVEATRRIREQFPQVIVIAYSADGYTQQDAFEAGAMEFVLMPVPPDRLTSIIRRVYREYHQSGA